MKIWKTSLAPGISSEGAPGTILASSADGLLVNCGTGAVRVIEIQMENCRRMEAKECWHNFYEGEVLG
jgi:methionyl-tRNA formyltransferase